MTVTVIIPSLNSPIIDQVLHLVQTQEHAFLIDKIIVVGRDEKQLIQPADKIQFIDTKQPVKASIARNLGIQATQSEILIFLDSDCLPTPDWLNQHLTAQQQGHLVVSGGVLPQGRNYWHLTYNLTLFHEFLTICPPGARDYLPTLNLSIHRSVITQVGGMDENIDRVEDIDWTTRMRRAGLRPYFWPVAAVYHNHHRDTLRLVKQDCVYSGYQMRHLRLRHPDMLQAPGFLRYPWLLLLLAPLIALAVTFRICWKQPATFLKYWYTLPAIYLTKIFWCWGASRKRF